MIFKPSCIIPTHLSFQNLFIIPQINCRRIANCVCPKSRSVAPKSLMWSTQNHALKCAPKPAPKLALKSVPKLRRKAMFCSKLCIAEKKHMLRREALWSCLSPSVLLLTLELFVASICVSARTLLNIQNHTPMDPTVSIKKSSIPLPETHQHSALHTHESIDSIGNHSTHVPLTHQHSKRINP